MKRILFLSNRGLLPIVDGHTRRSFNIIKGLSQKHEVYFLSLYENDIEISKENIRAMEDICCKVEFIKAPSKKISFSMLYRVVKSFFSIKPYTVWRHYSKTYLNRVSQYISSEVFDVVHCDILPIIYSISGRNDVFKSLTYHDVSYLKCLSIAKTHKSMLMKMFLYFESAKLKRLEKETFDDINIGIVVSESDKNQFQKISPNSRLIVVENGVDVNSFLPSDVEQEEGKLLWLGGFNHYSNKQAILYFLTDIYPFLKIKNNSISIDIIGNGVTAELKKFSDNDPSINFTGFVDDPLTYMNKAAVVVCPILSGGGTKLKTLESMSLAKAIVTTSVGCEGINGISGVHYLVADTAHDFVESILLLLRDNDLRMKLERASFDLILNKFNNVDIINRLNSFYEAI